jgi:enoyl-CoA hydratase
MAYETLDWVCKEGVARLTIQRPKALNALNRQVLEELSQVLIDFEQDPDLAVCILTGAGEKAFVAGADIAAMSAMTPLDAQRFCRLGQEVFQKIESIEKPVLAAVNGFALGGGCELMLACDMIFASETARFGQPEINLGVIPGFGGTQRLTKAIGMWRAKEWIYLGGMVDARKAYEIGLVNAVFPADTLLAEVEAIAGKLAGKPAFALGQAKKVIQNGLSLDLPTGMALEREAFALTFATNDRDEGMKAFLEKRKPSFHGN